MRKSSYRSCVVALVAASSIAVSCTHKYSRPALPSELAVADDVTLTSGETLYPDAMAYGPDQSIIINDRGQQIVVYTNQVQNIRTINRGQGLLEGLGLGILIGGGGGALLGFAGGDDSGDQFLNFSAGDKAVIFGVLFGIFGGGLGGIIGLVAGSKNEYDYQTPQLGVQPTQGGGQASLEFHF